MPDRAYVYEHGTLAIGEQGFTAPQFDALVRYNERHGGGLFQVGHRRLYFNSHVGVLQVGALAIEILPKTGKASAAYRDQWQNALLQMLHQSGLIEVESAPEADLRLRRSPLIDLYLENFVSEVERLSHAGLARKYRLCEGNLHKVKGRILFSQHLRRNLLHRERIYTAHQTYDRDNIYNQILKRALAVIGHLAVRSSMSARAAALGLAFESVSDVRILAETFERLKLDRNTQRYHRALQLARLIILNYAPDLTGGSNNVIAILFDMNELFERFILVSLHRARSKFAAKKIAVLGQLSKRFWGHKSIRPDVSIKAESEQKIEQFILDTKWKIPASNLPSDEDLKQIYVYNLQFGSARGLLIYPRADGAQAEIRHQFAGAIPPIRLHSCETCFVDLFGPDRKLRHDIGAQLLAHIMAVQPPEP